MKKQIAILVFSVLLTYFGSFAFAIEKEVIKPTEVTTTSPDAVKIEKRSLSMTEKAVALRTYASSNGYDTSVCFIINMNPASGAFRFFIFDFRADKFVDSGLVSHGRCNEAYLKGRKYSNEIGCGCTSVGRYKIGTKYNGRWGTSYRLHGLDETNNNAYTRSVVLHGHKSIPDAEIMYPLFQSDGCVTVSQHYFSIMSRILDNAQTPVLMEIYDSYELM